MNLIKKLPLTAFVLGLGLLTASTMSSFTSSKKLTPVTYYNLNGTFTTNDPALSGYSCQPEGSYCTAELEGINLPESFTEDNIPSSNPDYTVDLSPEGFSYQLP